MKKKLYTIGILICAGAVYLGLLSRPPSGASAAAGASLPVVANTLQLGGAANIVTLDGVTAYLGIGPRMHTFDVSDPANPVHLGQTPVLPGVVVDIAVADGVAYLAVVYGSLPGGGLHIFNVSDPLHPVQIGLWLSSDGVFDVAVRGDAADRRAYLAADQLYILDVSTPAAPVLTGFISTPTSVSEVNASGSLLSLLSSNRLELYDLASPDNPTRLGDYEGPWPATSVALQAGYAYITDMMWGITIVNISNPANPTLVGSFYDTGMGRDITVDGTTAYVANSGDGLLILDVSNPASPVKLGSVDTPADSRSLAYANNTVYLADGPDEFRVVDVSNPAAPALLSWWRSAGIPNSMHTTTGKLFSADVSGRFHIYDTSSSTVLVEVGFFEGIPSYTHDLEITGGKAYLAGDNEGMVILDITTYGAIKKLGTLPSQGERVYDVAVSNDYAYLANKYGGSLPGGLRVVDVSNAYSPHQVGKVDASVGGYNAIEVRSSIAYVAGDEKLIIYDVSSPSAPEWLGEINLEYAYDLVIDGDYAFIARQSSGVSIVDISNPAAPVLVKTLSSDNAYSLATAGDMLFIADRSSGLWAADISSPVAPRMVASYPAPYEMFFVTSDGIRAFGTDFHGGLMVFQMGAVTATDFIYMPLLAR